MGLQLVTGRVPYSKDGWFTIRSQITTIGKFICDFGEMETKEKKAIKPPSGLQGF
jgi:hypothetical protein